MKVVKVIVGVVIAAAVVAAAAFGVYKSGILEESSSDKVYVQSVSSIVNQTYGTQNSYMGIVETQKTVAVNPASDRKIAEVYVSVGDEVKEGDILFTYDTAELESELAQAQLDLESYDNEIAGYNNQIAELAAQRDQALEGEQFEYTTQIQSVQMSIQQVQNNKKLKSLEIEKLQASIANVEVTASMDGVIKTLNTSYVTNGTGDGDFITIVATGSYRVKGTINEQNIWSLSAGQDVIIRSRVDESITWTGTISEIDTENPENSSSSSMYYSSDSSSSTTSSKYPFYVELDSTDGLIVGQHVYIELDYGQDTTALEGIWLDMSYLVMDENETYVWARNDNGKLEKRNVTIGNYDENSGRYEILEGLSESDYIAVAMSCLYEGVICVTSEDEVDYSSPMYEEMYSDMSSELEDLDIDYMFEDGYQMTEDDLKLLYGVDDLTELFTQEEIDEMLGVTTDGESTDVESTDGELADGELADGEAADGETVEGEGATDGEAVE